MSNLGFQATDEDVQDVLKSFFGVEKTLDESYALVGRLKADRIERAALEADELDAQTRAAHREIALQLQEILGLQPVESLAPVIPVPRI